MELNRVDNFMLFVMDGGEPGDKQAITRSSNFANEALVRTGFLFTQTVTIGMEASVHFIPEVPSDEGSTPFKSRAVADSDSPSFPFNSRT
ncbi:hypothetical protein THAOC_26499, partial [Thalassiosira oceanica]